MISFLKSFITNRPQKFRKDNKYSDDYISTFSVPWGTVHGPILFFIIYTNGLLNIILDAEMYCYADDTVILLKHKNYEDLMILASKYSDKVKYVGFIIIIRSSI